MKPPIHVRSRYMETIDWGMVKKSTKDSSSSINQNLSEVLPFSSSLVNDVFVVVVSQTPTQLFIVHLGLVFPETPPSGNL